MLNKILDKINEIKDTVVFNTAVIVDTLKDEQLKQEAKRCNIRIKVAKIKLKRAIEEENIIHRRRIKTLKQESRQKVVNSLVKLGIEGVRIYQGHRQININKAVIAKQ